MPPLAIAPQLSLLSQLGENPIEVIGLDAHRFRDVGNGYAGLAAHKLQGLVGPCVTAAATATGARPAACGCTVGAGGAGRAAGTSGAPAGSLEGRSGRLQLGHLLLELAQPLIDVLHCGVDETRQITLLMELNGPTVLTQTIQVFQ